MSLAYCLTCNEQVHETAGGTCPLGHPVAARDQGPEPWVGFAAPTTTWPPEAAEERDVPMEHVGADGRHVAHAGVNGHARLDGSANGNALAGGHGADDLAALLAEALDDAEAPAPAPEEPTDTTTELGDDLTSLAAELQLDADQGVDDGPTASEPAPPAAPTPDASAFDEASIDSADIDALLAELTGSAPEPPSAAPEPPPAAPAPAPTTPPEAATPPPPPPPAAPPWVEPVPVSDSIPPLDDLRSPPPTAEEPPGLWDDTDLDAGVDHEAPAAPVDLTNFTARGRRVGGPGGATPRRRLGRKNKE